MAVYNKVGNRIDQSEYINATEYGAVGDGSTNNSVALQNAVNDCINKGNTLYIPEGVYVLKSLQTSDAGFIINGSIRIIGAGRGKTIIKAASTLLGGMHVAYIIDANNVQLSDLSIDGGVTTETRPSVPSTNGAHAIRIGNCNNIVITNVEVYGTSGYGIGQQSGSSQNVLIENVLIHDTGRDGIDFKNFSDTNQNLMINNVSVIHPGLTSYSTAQVGIDIRCKAANISNVFILLGSGTHSGLRCRSSNSTQGTGGKYVNVNNITVIGESGNTGYGISADTDGVKITNAHIENVGTGINIINKDNDTSGELPTRTHIINTDIVGCNTSAINIESDGNSIMNTSIENMHGLTAITVSGGLNHSFTGCNFVDCGTLFNIGNSVQAVNVIGCIGEDVTTVAVGNISALKRVNCSGLGN